MVRSNSNSQGREPVEAVLENKVSLKRDPRQIKSNSFAQNTSHLNAANGKSS